jgi:polysaccharide biosynthesis protein PelA
VASKKEDMAKARNYVLYYGHGREEELSRFDLAVVEPSGHDADSIHKLKDNGTLVFAYISVMEIQTWSPEFGLLKDTDFLEVNGQKLMNCDYGTYIMDLTSDRWKSLLLHKAGRMLLQYGYDGLFLDTIGDVEMPVIPAHMQTIQMSAAVNLLVLLRKDFPDSLIIQNNGLEKLCLYTADLIDGICWENPPFVRKECIPWVEIVVLQLEMLKTSKSLSILLLTEAKTDTATGKNSELCKHISTEKGFLFYCAPEGYINGINSPYNTQA